MDIGAGTPLGEQTIDRFLTDLAARAPAPGGGAVAGLHAAQAAALVSMVASYTTGPRYAEYEPVVAAVAASAARARADALHMAEEDARAFAAVGTAYRMPRSDDGQRERRSAAIAAALLEAARPPTVVVTLADHVLDLAERLLPLANRSVITDVAAASEAARAAATTARLNIEINLGGITDELAATRLRAMLDQVGPLLARAAAVERAVRAELAP